jgi:hypothetical protein
MQKLTRFTIEMQAGSKSLGPGKRAETGNIDTSLRLGLPSATVRD